MKSAALRRAADFSLLRCLSFDPLRHFFLTDEVIEKESDPAGENDEDDEKDFLDCVPTIDVPDVNGRFDCEHYTDNPNNET